MHQQSLKIGALVQKICSNTNEVCDFVLFSPQKRTNIFVDYADELSQSQAKFYDRFELSDFGFSDVGDESCDDEQISFSHIPSGHQR